MNFRTIKVIIGREYTTRVKKKSFLVTTFLVPILFAAFCILPSILMMKTKEKSQKVAVVDNSGIVMPFFVDNDAATYRNMTGTDPEEVKQNLEDMGLDVLVVVSPLDTVKKSVSVQAYSKKPLGVDFSESLSRHASDAVEDYRIASYGIADLDKIMDDVRANVKVTEYTIGESGEETLSESGIYMVLSMILGTLIYMFIAMFGGTVMASVIEEKASRVVEVLISSVKAIELMFGKIIGVALVALTQFFMWIALTLVLVLGAGAIFGFDNISGSAQAGNPTEMMSTMGVDSSAMGGTIDLDALAQTGADSEDAGEMGAILSTLGNLPYARLIVCFVIYFLLGYLLYASMYAAIGAAVENQEDTQQLQLPVTIPLMIAFLIVFFAFRNPESPVVFWGSMIPFTSPIVMIARIPFGVATWELVLSIVLLLLTFVLCAWMSAKIYKAGILLFGKKTSFKDMWKWLRQ